MKKHKYYYREKIKYCCRYSFKNLLLLYIRNNKFLTNSIRQRSMNKLITQNSFFNVNKLKKFCIISGRMRYILNETKFSRMIFKELCARGSIFGIMKNA
jgi:ribosomal protein S14